MNKKLFEILDDKSSFYEFYKARYFFLNDLPTFFDKFVMFMRKLPAIIKYYFVFSIIKKLKIKHLNQNQNQN